MASFQGLMVQVIEGHRCGFGSPEADLIRDLKAIGCTGVEIEGDKYTVYYENEYGPQIFIYAPRGRLFDDRELVYGIYGGGMHC